jgi:hypothetical protein
MQGNFPPSEAEFDTALRLNPGDAEVLTLYLPWASTFGHPERGGRRPPITPSASIRTTGHGRRGTFPLHILARGRFEDSLRILERLPKDNYNFYAWVIRAAS